MKMVSNGTRLSCVGLLLAMLCLLSTLSAINAAEDCLPDTGESGSLASVVLVVQTWESRSSNFHFDEPEMLSSESRTVPKSSEVSMVSGANVRFYGKEICVAVTKVTELEKRDGIDRSSSCEKSCFGVGSGTRLEIYSGTFGRPLPSDPACCFSGRIKTLRFFIPAPPTSPPPSYECVTCGPVDDCNSAGADNSTETCQAGEKCFTLKLQRKETSEVVTIKGCSHVLRYWGKHLDCDYQCKSNVRLWPDTPNYHYSVCASCCQGNKCNAHSVSSGVNSYGCNFFVTTAILSFVVYSVA